MSTYHADNVPVSVRTTSDGQRVVFGVVLEDVFLPFHWAVIGGFRDDMATAAQDEGQYLPGPTPAESPAAPEPTAP